MQGFRCTRKLKLKALLTLSTLVVAPLSFGEVGSIVGVNMTEVGKVKCFEKQYFEQNFNDNVPTKIDGTFCTYTVGNLASVSELSRKLEQALFNGEPLIEPEGILQAFGNNNQTLIFSHKNTDVLKQMQNLIPRLDTKEKFSPSNVIKVSADIYEVSETGLRNLGAGISSLKFGTGVSDLETNRSVTVSEAGLGLDLKLGAIQLSGLLSRENHRGNLNKVSSIQTEAYNLDSIDYSDITNIYQAPGVGSSIKDEEEGIRLNGKVSISDDDDKTVIIKDFNLYYGVRNLDGTINQLRIPRERLMLTEGIMFPIVRSKTTGRSWSRTGGVLSFNNSSSSENSKLLIYLSVKVLTWDEYIKSLKVDTPVEVKSKFTKAEKRALPKDCPDLYDVFDAIEVNAVRGTNGDPILNFKLDPEYACKKNIKKRFRVLTTGENLNMQENTHIMRLEELMLKGVRIQGLKGQSFAKPSFRLQIGFYPHNGKRAYKIHNAYFSRTTDFDISENFWIE